MDKCRWREGLGTAAWEHGRRREARVMEDRIQDGPVVPTPLTGLHLQVRKVPLLPAAFALPA